MRKIESQSLLDPTRKTSSVSVTRRKLETLLYQPEIESWRTLMGAYQSIYRTLERALSMEHCSVPRFQVLFYLYFEGPMTAASLSRRLFVTRGNISTFLKRLKSDKILGEIKHDHVKKRLLSLTTKGTQFFEELFPRHVKRVAALMPILDSKSLVLLKKASKSSES